MSDAYIEHADAMYTVAGTRVSLDSIVYAFLSGQSAEAIAQAFPVLNLEQVYGAITYYLAHRDDVDRYLESRRQDFEVARQAARDADPMFYQKLTDAKKAHTADALNAHPLPGRRRPESGHRVSCRASCASDRLQDRDVSKSGRPERSGSPRRGRTRRPDSGNT
jgi:uncharacterized protein (DUF433 family)